ncbi:DHHC zinc finger domain containing protein [Coccidioides posadasii C735 delta SOWgp]|nr:DHHC zinc finger domain containing protein [Coccidioides posadasii C735 delta SOWgp]EER28442.1 DHHC zinc finger domain containing protein [Coccidioides posadasii C735 delta SOWgp]|eukprot:XP_003070587.1 DHHC zinc finger domain containing protein [Coccidioides posadasii C735 delta SOWgp]
MGGFAASQLAVPAVCTLIAFLSYTSQYLFYEIDPGPLSKSESIKFNALVVCIWICYARACATDPGSVPAGWKPAVSDETSGTHLEGDPALMSRSRQRWCRRCEAFKPPRAHHCKSCQKCIPKMDHHCPWTNNCVSHFTYPHFLRFVLYAVISMIYLEIFLYDRVSIVWSNRNLPIYLGPSLRQLGHLFLLVMVNSMVLFALSVLLLRTIWMLLQNQTTIEGWEIERHRALLRRARVFGGYLDGPDGTKVRIEKQEFPFDIGIWENIQAGMGGSANVLSWFWPFSRTPLPGTGLDFEINGLDDPSLSWPPPDPDRMYRHVLPSENDNVMILDQQQNFSQNAIDAFRRRQELDYKRHQLDLGVQRRKPFHERYMQNIDDSISDGNDSIKDYYSSDSGEEGWRNSDGDRLRDFGVDEEAEFYDEDDIPLAVLIQRKNQAKEKSLAVGA